MKEHPENVRVFVSVDELTRVEKRRVTLRLQAAEWKAMAVLSEACGYTMEQTIEKVLTTQLIKAMTSHQQIDDSGELSA